MYYNAERDRLDTYSGSNSDSLEEISMADFSSDGTYPVVQTADVKAILGITTDYKIVHFCEIVRHIAFIIYMANWLITFNL